MSRARAWTAAEKQVLRDEYLTTPLEELAQRLGRTAIAVQGHAVKIGAGRRRGPGPKPSSSPNHPTAFGAGWCRYPQEFARALSRLAQSDPAPDTYEREKRRLLEALNGERRP